MQNSIGDQSMSKRPNDAQIEKQKREASQTSRFIMKPPTPCYFRYQLFNLRQCGSRLRNPGRKMHLYALKPPLRQCRWVYSHLPYHA
jgi:hypothetical protein